eukprot:scaffold20188_cov68-Phaeocystis_antarctica.AAC.1
MSESMHSIPASEKHAASSGVGESGAEESATRVRGTHPTTCATASEQCRQRVDASSACLAPRARGALWRLLVNRFSPFRPCALGTPRLCT